MEKPKIVTVLPSKAPNAVKAFLEQEARYEAWKRKHADALAELRDIAKVYNPSLKAAHAAVKLARVRILPFDLYQWQTNRNAEVLYDEVGRNRFAQCGGKLEPEWKNIDDVLFDSLVAQQRLDEKLVAKVVTFTPKFHAPGAIELP